MFNVLLDAPATPQVEIQIAKLGDFQDGRYGEFSITETDVADWRRNLEHLPGGRAPIDLDHSADRSPRRTEAAGWITDIALKDGVPKATVEWTPVGKSAIEDKRYLFFSPTYGEHKTETGEVHENTLIGGALTNRPFLAMPALTLASEDRLGDAIQILDQEQRDRLTLAQLTTLDISPAMRKKHAVITKKIGDTTVHMFPVPPGDKEHARKALQLLPSAEKAGHITAAEGNKVRARANEVLGKKLADSRRHMTGTLTLDKATLTTLGVADEDTQTKILALDPDEQAAAIADALKPADPEPTKTLEDQARENGKMLLDADELKTLQAQAASGAKAAGELAAQKFDSGYKVALSKGKAVPAEKAFLESSYDRDPNGTLKFLDDRPPVVQTIPQGEMIEVDGQPVPAGVDPTGFQLDKRVKDRAAKLKELGQAVPTYSEIYAQILGEGE